MVLCLKFNVSKKINYGDKKCCGHKLLIYLEGVAPVSAFMVNCWQLVGLAQKNAPQLFTCTIIQLQTPAWEIISHMNTSQCDCFTAVLPDDQLMLVGG